MWSNAATGAGTRDRIARTNPELVPRILTTYHTSAALGHRICVLAICKGPSAALPLAHSPAVTRVSAVHCRTLLRRTRGPFVHDDWLPRICEHFKRPTVCTGLDSTQWTASAKTTAMTRSATLFLVVSPKQQAYIARSRSRSWFQILSCVTLIYWSIHFQPQTALRTDASPVTSLSPHRLTMTYYERPLVRWAVLQQ